MFLKVLEYSTYATGHYKITQNSLNFNAHDKTALISVWTNPIASFIFVEGSMAKINTHSCPRVLIEKIWRKISLKNLGFWNAYYMYSDRMLPKHAPDPL